jgi:hypothetical protein
LVVGNSALVIPTIKGRAFAFAETTADGLNAERRTPNVEGLATNYQFSTTNYNRCGYFESKTLTPFRLLGG